MIRYVVTTAGGLGNQMMNYALCKLYKNQGKKVVLYPVQRNLQDHNGYELNRVFKNTEKPSEYSWLYETVNDIGLKLNKIYSFVAKKTGMKPFNIQQTGIIRIINFPLAPSYDFTKIREELLHCFEYPELKDERNKGIRLLMQSSESVSIHVRRGDYQNNDYWRTALGDICDKAYFDEAIQTIKRKFSNPTFFVFSDDMEWVRANFSLPNVYYIDWNKKENSYMDMQLMSYCKCNIIVNSTFSLMAAWTNRNNDYIVIAPKKWRNYPNDDTWKKYLSPKWIAIDNMRPHVLINFNGRLSDKDIKNIRMQSISDFIVISTSPVNTKDKRFRTIYDRKVPFIMECDRVTIGLFSDRQYLKNWLISNYKR